MFVHAVGVLKMCTVIRSDSTACDSQLLLMFASSTSSKQLAWTLHLHLDSEYALLPFLQKSCSRLFERNRNTSHSELFNIAELKTTSKFSSNKATLCDNGTVLKVAENTETFTTLDNAFTVLKHDISQVDVANLDILQY
mmetsp:Transcript_17869/g.21043  ORF Transcript_17869/g.21043 Transcript_17869/m.21043 type:complete len:139 (-) Transcript_17869:498-914(-)